MAEITGISWCDATINFWHGCKKVSEGCKYCYMYRDKARWMKDGSEVKKTNGSTINRILKELNIRHWDRVNDDTISSLDKGPLKIFTCSWSDFFIDEADEWREEAWEFIRQNKQFIWIILTKRIDRVKDCLPKDWGEGWGHVWLGVSAENQQRWNERVPALLDTPAKVRFVSCEPLIGPIDINKWAKSSGTCFECNGSGSVEFEDGGVACPTCNHDERFQQGDTTLDWIIVGGESGNDIGPWKYRPCQLKWIKDIVKKASDRHVSIFVKQLGTHLGKELKLSNRSGEDHEQWPEWLGDIKLQQFPNEPDVNRYNK